MYKLFDGEGHTLVLRPDMTTPIARISASRLKDTVLPYRIYYISNVFRHTGVETGRQREFYQAGMELLGAKGPAADAEMIALAVKVLETVGLVNVRFDISHVGFVQALLEAGGFTDTEKEDIRHALMSKDFVGLKELLESLNHCRTVTDILLALPGMRGGMELIESLMSDLEDIQGAKEALTEIRDTIEYLEAFGIADKLYLDLGMVKDFSYYTGVIIEGYTPDLGAALCTGGRYDSLIEHFGFKCPATGFALGIEWVMAALERQGWYKEHDLTIPPDAVVLIGTAGRANALRYVDALRISGLKVMVELLDRCFDDTKAYAVQRGAKWLLVVDGETASGELYNLANGHSHERMDFARLSDILHGRTTE
jgi:ATP phosphoribosyltransferase regulatory subunit